MRILVCEDQQLVREGIYCILSTLTRVTIVDRPASDDILSTFRAIKPDVVLLATSRVGTSAHETLRRLVKADRKIKILVLGTESDRRLANHWIRSGAKGFISLQSSARELVDAVNRLAHGKVYLDGGVAPSLSSEASAEKLLNSLTMRQIEILRLLGAGASLRDIAGNLGISYKTAANTCTKIRTKLGVKRNADLIRLAIHLDLG